MKNATVLSITVPPVMLHSINQDGHLVSVNDYWLEVLGHDRAEVLGRKSVDFLTEASRCYVREVALPRRMKTGSVQEVELQRVKKSGEVRDVLLSGLIEPDQSGEMISRVFLVDVTDRKRAEAARNPLQRVRTAQS